MVTMLTGLIARIVLQYMQIPNSLCCIHETNEIVYINFTPITIIEEFIEE